MTSRSQRSRRRDAGLLALDGFIQALSVAKDTCGIPPAQIALGSAYVLLTTIKDEMDNKDEYIDLGLSCGDVCEALDGGLNGRGPAGLSEPVHMAIEKLTTTVADIQGRVDERSRQNVFSRAFSAQSDKDAIAAWKQELKGILRVFDNELHPHALVGFGGIGRSLPEIKDGEPRSVHNLASLPIGEFPPPAPKAFFGRDRLIEEIVSLAEKFQPIALVGPGGIGKTSIALTVLHDPRIKERFGDNRRFLRCDKFTPSRVNFLAQLSKVIGAGIENPEDLSSLHPLLSSKPTILILDNAESILDPQGTDAREIYIMVKELGDFSNICLGITSRISTIPPHCQRLEIPTLSLKASCDIFYGIYNKGGRSKVVSDLVRQLDYHALSITLLATTASHNMWEYDQLAEEWNTKRAQVLQTDYDQSLAATIELSLTSPTFRKLGSSACEILGVVAFFPQGVDRNNLEWLFPTIPDIKPTFSKFCSLSLTHRNNNFITMLAPIREYLTPRDPRSSPLLCAIRDRYFSRLSVDVHPTKPGFDQARWIISEDTNVEHLLNAFASTYPNADNVWDACSHFMEHLYWHKPQKTVLESKIKNLPDHHRCKPRCLFELSQLFDRVGNYTEQKLLLSQTLKLERERGHESRVATTLRRLADANRRLKLFGEGIHQAKEALKIHKRLDDTIEQANTLNVLAYLLYWDDQLDAAEDAATRAIDLVPEEGQEYLVCKSHRFLGQIYQHKGQKAKAIQHFEISLSIASPFGWHDQLFWSHYYSAKLYLGEDELDEANGHIEQAKSHADENDNSYNLGRAMETQADIWRQQHKLEDAKFEVSRALEIFEDLGATQDTVRLRHLLQRLSKQ